jgi:hypothetical protein
MRLLRTRRVWTVVSVTAGLGVLASGAAYAYWSATGSGSAAVGSVTAQPLTVAASSTVVVDLYPGKTDTVSFAVNNPNPYPVSLSGASVNGAATSNNEALCPGATNLTVATGPFSLSGTVPAASGSTPGTLTVSIAGLVTMKTTADNNCQGRTFTVPLTVSGTQQ